MKKLGVMLAALVLIAGMSLAAFAADATVQVKVKPKPKITIETDVSEVNFGELDPDTPTTINNAVTVRVKTNKPYDLSYTATDFTDGTNTMPISNLEYADAGSGSWTAFANGPVYLVTDGPRGVDTLTYDFRITVPWDVAPEATYTASITYTAVQK